jgi:TP901 family phage tail tape measure protein
MVEAATSYRKNGFNDEDSAQLAKISAMFQNVADEQISAGDAADFLISQLIAFNGTGPQSVENAEHIVDAVNAVSNAYSVSSGDLAQALSVVASSSSAMGNSFEETLAVVTAITEQTRSASKAARGTNTIFANLAQVLDDNSPNGKKILEIYKNLELTMFDTNGQLKSGYELLSELSKKWPDLDSNTQKYIATTLAGTNQLNNFLALMNNFQHATDATTTALESQGSAVQENNRYLESIAAKVSALKATFQDLSNNVISDEFVKRVLDFANDLLKIANTDFGRVITQILLISTATWGAGELLKVSKLLPTIIGQFTSLGTIAGAAGAAGGITSMADAAAAASLVLESSLLPAILAVVVIGAGLVAAFKAIDAATADSRKSFSELGEDIEKNTSKLETNKQRLEEINALPWNEKTTEILSEKDALEKENEELQKQIDKYEKLQQKKAKNTISGGTISEIRYGISSESTGLGKADLVRATNVNFSSYEELVKYLDRYIPDASKKTKAELEALGIVFETNEQQVYKVGDSYENELIARAKELDEALKNNHKLTTEQQEDYEEVTSKLGDLADAHDYLGSTQNNAKDTLEALNATYETYTIIASNAVGQTALTDEQITELTNKYPQLASAINVVNGQHYLNIEALQNVTGATAEEIQETYNAIAALTIFNNMNLDVTQKVNEMVRLANAANIANASVSSVLGNVTARNHIIAKLRSQGKTLEEAQALADDEYLKSVWSQWTSSTDFSSKITKGTYTPSTYTPKTSSSKSTKKASDEATKSQKKEKTAVELSTEAWKEQLSLLKDKLELLEKSGATDQEQIDQMTAIQKAIHEQADKYRALNLRNESEEVRQLGILWWDYANDISDLRKKMADEKKKQDEKDEAEEKERLEKAKARAEELYETEKKLWEERLEKQKSDYETAVNVVLKKIDEEVEKLNKQRDETEKFYDDQIQALQDTNDELDRQIQKEQLLENLAKAQDKTLYVFKDGRFQYLQDTEAIAEAQAQLDAYNREEALRKETENLNKQKENALKAIDEQIKGWNKYREQWEKVTTDYQEQQDKLIAQQVLGIDLEQKNWQTRLTNVQDFVDKYNNILSQLDAGYPKTLEDYYKDQGLNSDGTAWSGSGYDPGTGSGGSLRDDGKVDYKDDSPGKDMDKDRDGHVDSDWLEDNGAPDWVSNAAAARGHANGTLSAEPGLSLVGERGPELRVLGGGEGIIPADITRNLWNWGKINPSAFAQSMNNVFNIDNLSLPSVTNAQNFITGLRQMAYQRAYQRA